MPGFSRIFGLIPCSNYRVVSQEKPRSITMDAEIVVGFDNSQTLQATMALLTHFVAFDQSFPSEGLYFVSGKIGCFSDDISIGDGFDRMDYDFVVDADVVRSSLLYCPRF